MLPAMSRHLSVAALFLVALWVSGCSETTPADDPEAYLSDLEALGYLSTVSAGNADAGVTLHDPERVAPGLIVFSSQVQKKAFLLDADGTIVHAWSSDRKVGHVELNDAGELFAIHIEHGLRKLDWQGNEIWLAKVPGIHHDFDFPDDGRIYLLKRAPIEVEHAGERYPILNDYVQLVTSDGQVLDDPLSLFDLVGDRIADQRWAAIRSHVQGRAERLEKPDGRQRRRRQTETERDIVHDTPYDVFHTNTVEVLKRDLPGVYERGDLLLSVRELDLVLIVDPQTREIRWSYGPGEISRQHHPSLLENGNVLLFDNGRRVKRSRVIEVDPKTSQIVWSYEGDPPEAFFSFFRGAAQRLPNGNTLITDSAKGRIFEVTHDGEIVWTYYTPLWPERANREREVVFQALKVWGETERRLREMASGS